MAGEERRQSARVTSRVPVQVKWTTPEGQAVEEHAYTEDFSNLGARLRLKTPIEIGQEVTVVNEKTGETATGCLVWVGTRTDPRGRKVAFAFVKPAPDFWGTVTYGH